MDHDYAIEDELATELAAASGQTPYDGDGKDEAWGGAETSDGRLLVVGTIDNEYAFISRFNLSGGAVAIGVDGSISPRKETRLVPGWRRIMDIKPIGNDRFVIVGKRVNGGNPFLSGEYKGVGIAILTVLPTSSNTGFSFSVHEFDFSSDDASEIDAIIPANSSFVIADLEAGLVNAVVKHNHRRDLYSVVVVNETEQIIFILQITYKPLSGFNLVAVSEIYSGLRFPQSIAACGDHLVVAGQTNTGVEALVIASWLVDDLVYVGDYTDTDGSPVFHKAKMVACAGPKGVLACGAFDDLTPTRTMGLAYFPDPATLDLYDDDYTTSPFVSPYYFTDDINNFPLPTTPPPLDPYWPGGGVGYAEAMAPRSLGGWILAGHADDDVNNSWEVMAAMVVAPTDNTFTDFSVSHFTEVFIGEIDTNTNQSVGGNCVANYVIELTQGRSRGRRYALIGRANWEGDDGNTYVVIVEEP